MAEYKHGEMDVTEHEKTFAGFVRFVTWAVVIIFLVLIFLGFVNA